MSKHNYERKQFKQKETRELTEYEKYIEEVTRPRFSSSPPGWKSINPNNPETTNGQGKPCMPPTKGSQTQKRKANRVDKGGGTYGKQGRHSSRGIAGNNRARLGHSKRQILRTVGCPFNKIEGTAEDYVK